MSRPTKIHPATQQTSPKFAIRVRKLGENGFEKMEELEQAGSSWVPNSLSVNVEDAEAVSKFESSDASSKKCSEGREKVTPGLGSQSHRSAIPDQSRTRCSSLTIDHQYEIVQGTCYNNE